MVCKVQKWWFQAKIEATNKMPCWIWWSASFVRAWKGQCYCQLNNWKATLIQVIQLFISIFNSLKRSSNSENGFPIFWQTNRKSRMIICTSLYSHQRISPFLDRLVICDEKRNFNEDVKRRKQWLSCGEQVKPQPQKDFHAKISSFCLVGLHWSHSF